MEELPEIGLRLHGGLDPRSCIDLAQAAEANGFASLWFAENPLQRGVLPAASACALLTRRLRIGLGIINVYSHHPTLIAMEFAALDELADGRARLGIGSGIGRLIERIGFAWQPLAATRDALHIVRRLLAGEEMTYRGQVFSVHQARLAFRARSPRTPIYMAAMGDRSLRLCGRLAEDRKSTRLNSSHPSISYAVFCSKKKQTTDGRFCSSLVRTHEQQMAARVPGG